MTVGFFGKMPGHGDFVERGLPAEFKQPWDNWLQHGMSASRAALGADWLNTYLTSPVWRFALCGGICGSSGWAGVLVPSVDKVGRYFPLTLASSFPAAIMPIQMMVAGADWHDQAQEIALSALQQDDVDAEAVAAALAGLGELQGKSASLPLESEAPAADGNSVMQARGVSLPFTFGTSPGQGLLAFTHRLTESRFPGGYSVWWTHGSALVHPNMVVCGQLPAPEAFAAFLSDQMAPPGWVRMSGYRIAGAAPGQGAEPVGSEPVNVPTGQDAPAADASQPSAEPARSPGQLEDLLGDARDLSTLRSAADLTRAAQIPASELKTAGLPSDELPAAELPAAEPLAPGLPLTEAPGEALLDEDTLVPASAAESVGVTGATGVADDVAAAQPSADSQPEFVTPQQVSSDEILAGFGGSTTENREDDHEEREKAHEPPEGSSPRVQPEDVGAATPGVAEPAPEPGPATGADTSNADRSLGASTSDSGGEGRQ